MIASLLSQIFVSLSQILCVKAIIDRAAIKLELPSESRLINATPILASSMVLIFIISSVFTGMILHMTNRSNRYVSFAIDGFLH